MKVSFLLIIIAMFALTNMATGQNRQYSDTISYEEVLRQLDTAKEGVSIENSYVSNWSNDWYSAFTEEREGDIFYHPKKDLSFTNCFMHPNIFFKNLMLNSISFKNAESGQSIVRLFNKIAHKNGGIYLKNCQINTVLFSDKTKDVSSAFKMISIKNCSLNDVYLTDVKTENFEYVNNVSQFFGTHEFSISENCLIEHNTFNTDNENIQLNLYQEDTVYTDLTFTFNFSWEYTGANIPFGLVVKNNAFNCETSLGATGIRGIFKHLEIVGNTFQSHLQFNQADVDQSLEINSNIFEQSASLKELFFSEKENSVGWGQFSNYKLSLINEEIVSVGSSLGNVYERGFYSGNSSTQVADSLKFFKLMSVYHRLDDLYNRNGETQYANSCYAELKEVEAQRWKYLFTRNKTFESFFRWQLNNALSYFTDYGTNPAKAVVKSGWIILLFAIFYLFFPSDWDANNRNLLFAMVKNLVAKNRDKSLLTTLAFIAYYIFIDILNAVTLSLNAFTTLGFGDIPTHGVGRYVTIIEGFVGWFILTIFSVSLINQVLG